MAMGSARGSHDVVKQFLTPIKKQRQWKLSSSLQFALAGGVKKIYICDHTEIEDYNSSKLRHGLPFKESFQRKTMLLFK
jgi:hypothetical protein